MSQFRSRSPFGRFGGPGGPPEWREKRRFLFLRFARFFGAALLLFVLGIAGLAYLFTRLFGGGGQVTVVVWLGGCGLALAIPLVAGFIALRSFTGLADPLARVMAAADAVAAGDFSVRLVETGAGEFGRLATSFNHMAAELERTDRQRRNLTADVAHELRTPLHIIQGNLEGILDGVYQADPEQINLLLDETRQLTRLVEDLRTLSLAETGQLSLHMESLDVNELVTDAATSFSAPAEDAGLTLLVKTRPGLAPLSVVGDAGRLDQVLSNLLANALRFTPAGGALTLETEEAPEQVRIRLADTGRGIPPEDLPFIFDRFWQGDRSRHKTGGAGSGLGLAIARQLVQAHGGQIRVESQVGSGTVFTIELPKKQP
jgi:signal transduction histidine kinase